MRKERYIVEIEMPNGDAASSMYIQGVIQSDCDIEDDGRWKVSIKEYWKPSDEQMNALLSATCTAGNEDSYYSLIEDLKKLKEE